ncbi:MAG: hypothetical protein M5U09_09340 [Gammaproteobacteria bacterium]|nr:hypothetical protein [Gammaproteobacteria bacterium]
MRASRNGATTRTTGEPSVEGVSRVAVRIGTSGRAGEEGALTPPYAAGRAGFQEREIESPPP